MKWIKYCKLVIIIRSWRKNVDYLSSPLGCARWNHPMYPAFGVLSVWWKMDASGSLLFRTVVPHFHLWVLLPRGSKRAVRQAGAGVSEICCPIIVGSHSDTTSNELHK